MMFSLSDRRQRDRAPTLAEILAYQRGWQGRLAALVHRLRHDELGALTLTEAAKLTTDQLQQAITEIFVLESPILARLPLLFVAGNSFKYNEEAALPGVEFRAVNSAYTESTGTFNQRTEVLVILGGDADVDRYIVRSRGNLIDQRAAQTRGKVKAAVIKFQDTFINGDVAVDANAFDGLKKRLTGTQVIDAATNGLPIIGATSADRQAFFDKLDELIAAVPGLDGSNGALVMNSLIRAKIRGAARREGSWGQTDDEFGRVVELYNGIPMLDVGNKADGTNIIPITETQGSSTDASSIYAVKFADDEVDNGVAGITNTDDGGEGNPIGVRDLGEIDTKPVLRTRIEFYCGVAVFGKGAARLRGARNA